MAKKESKKVEAIKEEVQPVIMNGLVVTWNIPSQASLEDWVRLDNKKVRIREIVELYPEDVKKLLEAIRRNFYRQVMRYVVPAYSLKILAFDDVPKVQQVIQHTKKSLKVLDDEMQEALDSKYHRDASKYFEKASGNTPRVVKKLSERFYVSMIPLRLDIVAWEEFLTKEMEKQKERIQASYDRKREDLEGKIELLRKQEMEKQQIIYQLEKDMEAADQKLDDKYAENVLPVDVTVLKTTKKELEASIDDLKFKEKELMRKVNRLKEDSDTETQSYQRGYGFAREVIGETEKKVTYEAAKLWADNLESLVKEALEVQEMSREGDRTKRLKAILETADQTNQRILSIQPSSQLTAKYQKFIGIITAAIEGKPYRDDLETLS